LIVHIKQLKNQTEKFKPNDYRLLKKYDVIQISEEEKWIVPGVHNEQLFNILQEVHLSIGHGGRNRMKYEINMKFKNITRKSIMLYLNNCHSCQKKGSKAKKGLVVKPVISYLGIFINIFKLCILTLLFKYLIF